MLQSARRVHTRITQQQQQQRAPSPTTSLHPSKLETSSRTHTALDTEPRRLCKDTHARPVVPVSACACNATSRNTEKKGTQEHPGTCLAPIAFTAQCCCCHNGHSHYTLPWREMACQQHSHTSTLASPVHAATATSNSKQTSLEHLNALFHSFHTVHAPLTHTTFTAGVCQGHTHAPHHQTQTYSKHQTASIIALKLRLTNQAHRQPTQTVTTAVLIHNRAATPRQQQQVRLFMHNSTNHSLASGVGFQLQCSVNGGCAPPHTLIHMPMLNVCTSGMHTAAQGRGVNMRREPGEVSATHKQTHTHTWLTSAVLHPHYARQHATHDT